VSARVLLIDNYDSFTYNLVQAFRMLGADVTVKLNDEIDVESAQAIPATHLVVSPGPGAPPDAGQIVDIIRSLASRLPVLGVCLGHQAIVEAFGGKVARAPTPMHGKVSRIRHDGRGVFRNLNAPMDVGRYHSLIAAQACLPTCLAETAHAEGGEIMGVRHKEYLVEGVQFHPESILTPEGDRLLQNFLDMTAPA
jgi:anthranilate synthase/aminodeoxychorismate synthase-like glutamine amidotransferase